MLSTPAKIGIGALATVTVGGIGYGIARAAKGRKKEKPKGMRRDDGKRPAASDRKVVAVSFDEVYDASEVQGTGFPVEVGTRYEIAMPKDVADEFTAGRRIADVIVAKVINGKPELGKEFTVSADTFSVRHQDLTVSFDFPARTLGVTIDRAGLYVVALVDRDGREIVDEMVFLATAAGAAVEQDDVQRFESLRAFLIEASQSPDGALPAAVGVPLEMPQADRGVSMPAVQTVSVAKVVGGSPLPAQEWSVHRGKAPLGFAVGTDLEVEYAPAENTLRIVVARAGLYEVRLLDVSGRDLTVAAVPGAEAAPIYIRAN